MLGTLVNRSSVSLYSLLVHIMILQNACRKQVRKNLGQNIGCFVGAARCMTHAYAGDLLLVQAA